MLQVNRRMTYTDIRAAVAAVVVAGVLAAPIGCSRGSDSGTSRAPVAGKLTATATPAPQTGADSDRAAPGAGLPSGYNAVFDNASAKVSDVSYSEKEPGRWEVRTGPAHILFSRADTAANKYSVSATFEQVEAPAHPEAFGVFVGGTGLGGPDLKYTYFIVRGNGMYMVKVRDGSGTRTITDWTAQPSIPKQDAAGKALYGIRIDVAGNAAHVSVNGVPITTIQGKDAPLNGIAGVRINHNLHLIVTPVSLIR